MICEVKALVEATAISGPEWMYTPPSDSRGIVEPTTLQMPRTVAPLRFSSRMANRVSAVSPLWDTTKCRVLGSTTGLR